MNLHKILKLSLFLSLIWITESTLAMQPLRDPLQLWEAQTEQVLGVEGVRVILADYDLIRNDFPEIRILSNNEVDQWLVRNTGFISKQQAGQSVVNSPIKTSGQTRLAYRPREYRRAHVFVVDTGGLIDAKGTGAIDPSGGSHDNGLASLGEAIREYVYEKLVHAIFQKDGRFDTVRTYAVLDFGFNIKHPDTNQSRAGLVLRQAHVRYHDGPLGVSRGRGQATMLPRDLQLNVEMLLRSYGITSTIKFDGNDLINLQGASTEAVIDFGSFLTEQKFVNPVYYFYDSNGNPVHSDLASKPGQSNFVQPDPSHQIPFELWGYSQTGRPDPKYDNPNIWAHELAEALATGRATRADAEQHVRNMLENTKVKKALLPDPRSCSGIL